MKHYIGTKVIKAKIMSAEDAAAVLGRMPSLEHAEGEEATVGQGIMTYHPGYLVEYKDGYKSWSPAKQFESTYTQMHSENRVTKEDVQAAIASEVVQTINLHDKPVTLVEIQLRNGFTIRETATCVDPVTYCEAVGADICRSKIQDKIWMLLGFLLQQGISGNCK